MSSQCCYLLSFVIQVEILQVLGISDFSLQIKHFGYYIMRLWCKILPHYSQVEMEVHVLLYASVDI